MKQRLIWILWPGFVAAIPAVGILFSLVDPGEVRWAGEPVEGRLAAYTIGFGILWATASAASALTCFLQRSPFEINRCPLPATARPEGCPKRSGEPCT